MSRRGGIDFAFVAAPVGEEGLSDAALYKEILADCEFAHRAGYRAAWMIEHHFSDYFPTPNPLAFLSHIAARFPDFALGTCVLVTPWYEPLRLAEEIAQLNLLTDQPLHLGLGRGTAKYEYDAFGVPMEESRQRFREVWEIVSSRARRRALPLRRPVSQRPHPRRAAPPLRHEQDQLLRRRRRQP